MTHNDLLELLHYDPCSGELRWRKARGNRAAGAVAGSTDRHGYVYVHWRGRGVAAHRLAVFYMTGKWPPDQVDHVNRNKSDNRWSNLRLATAAENSRNAPARSGIYKGVTRHSNGKWMAQIRVNNRNKYLGLHATPADAHNAYCAAAAAYFGEFASNN